MHGFSFIEIITIVATFFGCAFALIRTGSAPRQVWRAAAAAFGCGILTLGVCGTTQFFLQGLQGLSGGSKATRELAFVEILEHAYRPMFIGVIGLLLFWMVLRSTSSGDSPGVPSVAGPAATLMVGGAIASLVGIAIYHVGFVIGLEAERITLVMLVTFYVGLFTVLVCAIGGLWALMRGGAWQPDDETGRLAR
jgi:hypothetical protein